MRRKIVAGNWKLHGTRDFANRLVGEVAAEQPDGVDVVILPPLPYLGELIDRFRDSRVLFGAQDVSSNEKGAYTGEVSAAMLVDVGAVFGLVGHSERRQYHLESSELVARKFRAALNAGLRPILCVGETLEQREAGATESVLASQLHLELTETAVIDDEMQASNLLAKLHGAGIKVWLDDFGTGFSGLSYLKRVPVDGVKIDRSFVVDLPRDPDDLALTTAIISMAHSLGITVVAEGIEKRDQYELLRERGCDLMQGYWMSHPLTADEFAALLAQPPRDIAG